MNKLKLYYQKMKILILKHYLIFLNQKLIQKKLVFHLLKEHQINLMLIYQIKIYILFLKNMILKKKVI